MSAILSKLSDSKLTELLQNGGVGVLPTDTVYGLVCRASDPMVVKRLYEIKKRENKPGTVIAANIDQLVELGIKMRYLKAVDQFWPDAISIVIPCGPELTYLHLGKHSLAVRLPADGTLNTLINKTGPLLTTSANLPGKKPADKITEAQKYFGDSVDFYVDGGDLSGRLPSTLIRIVDDAVEVLRPGAVNTDETGTITL